MLKIEYRKVNEINPYDNNPRQNDDAVDEVARSIKEFGFKNPVIIDKEGIIVAGHTRIRAAKKLGIEEIPTIQIDDLTPEQIKAFRIADNRTAEWAQWDNEALAREFEELELLGYELDNTGFDLKAIEEIMAMEDEDIEIDEDDFILEVPEDPITQPGDVWLLGPHRLMCGDSTSTEEVKKLMDGEEADLIITDPPYNVAYEGAGGMTIQNDDMGDQQFHDFLLAAYKAMHAVAKPGTPIYVFHADTSGGAFRNAFAAADWRLTQVLIWVKNGIVLGRQDYQWKHEPILYGWKEGAAHKWHGARNKSTVIDDDPPIDTKKMTKPELIKLVKELQESPIHTTIIREDKPLSSDIHPTMKPLKLIGYLMKNSSIKRNRVLDVFGGSGSTMMAAEQLGRTAYLMELDEGYADANVNRYIKFKGSSEEVYLIRNGTTKPYADIEK